MSKENIEEKFSCWIFRQKLSKARANLHNIRGSRPSGKTEKKVTLVKSQAEPTKKDQ